jgi:hypothetical protein
MAIQVGKYNKTMAHRNVEYGDTEEAALTGKPPRRSSTEVLVDRGDRQETLRVKVLQVFI